MRRNGSDKDKKPHHCGVGEVLAVITLVGIVVWGVIQGDNRTVVQVANCVASEYAPAVVSEHNICKR